MTFLDICAGIGGISLGLESAGMTCAGQVEKNEFCEKILKKHWPHVPKWHDITTVAPGELPTTDLIAAGYPCQPFSQAGERRGDQDDRYIWPSLLKIVTAKRPPWCLFENVAGHVSLGLDKVLSDMEGIGYSCQPIVIPACARDAHHRRDRVWIVAHEKRTFYPDSLGDSRAKKCDASPIPERQGQYSGILSSLWPHGGRWPSESGVDRVAYGVPDRMDRLRALGNAVVPQVVEAIGIAILSAEKENINEKI